MGARLGRSLVGAFAVGALFFASGCETSGDGAQSKGALESNLEIFSWWIAPGEVEALDALLETFTTEHPEVKVTNAAAIDAETQRSRLKERLETGEPPDSFQALSGVDLFYWVKEGKMESLESMPDIDEWRSVFPEQLLDVVSVDGKMYGVPLNIERDNNMYYSIQAFEDAGLEPPRTLSDFYTVCDAFQSDGMSGPLAVPAAGWVLALVAFETLMPAVTGGEFYLDYFRGNADPDDPKVREFFTELKKVLQCSDVATADDSWGSGADQVYDGKSAMYVMGDWGKAYLEGSKYADDTPRQSWTADVEFGMVPGLGSDGYFTFNSAVFGLPKNVTHPKAARAFLETVGSKEGQTKFNPIKGSLPARLDVSAELFDEMTQRSSADFKAASEGDNKLLPGYASLTLTDYQNAINPSLLVFAVGGERAQELDKNVPDSELAVEALDLDYIVGKMKVHYPLLQVD